MSDVMPPTPMESASAALKDSAKNKAQGMLMTRMRKELKGFLPKFLWPLIPGEKGTVTGEAKKAVSKRFWAAVGSCVFSIVFFGVVAMVLFFTFAVVAWAIVMG